MYDCFSVFLDSVSKNLIEDFCILIREFGLKFSIFVGSFCGLGIRVLWLRRMSWEQYLPFLFCGIVCEELELDLFEGLVELCTKPIWSWPFFGS